MDQPPFSREYMDFKWAVNTNHTGKVAFPMFLEWGYTEVPFTERMNWFQVGRYMGIPQDHSLTAEEPIKSAYSPAKWLEDAL